MLEQKIATIVKVKKVQRGNQDEKMSANYDERRVVMLKSKVLSLEGLNLRLRRELKKKDSAFMKCGDLCAFFSKVLSNEYVTLERSNGFRVPLGRSLI